VLLIGIILTPLGLAGCATPPPSTDPDAVADFKATNDPLEPTNRVFFAVNNGLDVVFLRPVALLYHYAVPETVRLHTHNVLTNLGTPVVLANDMLQGKPTRAGDTLMRMAINTTVGVVGVFDVATDWGYPEHDSDFGMTLALWGMPDGVYLFLPVLGPSNPRDVAGFGMDTLADPLTWIGQGAVVNGLRWGRVGLAAIDERERVLTEVDQIYAEALDPYATIRSLSRQHRQGQIDDARSDNRMPQPWPAAK
jgi:phospholipid-binding lipoprotein MlaA